MRPTAAPPRRRRQSTRQPGRPTRTDRGSATAELAVSMIGLVAALLPLFAGLQLVAWQARAQETARAVARDIARGENSSTALARSRAVFPQATTAIAARGGDAVVNVAVPVRLSFGPTLTVRAMAVAVPEQA